MNTFYFHGDEFTGSKVTPVPSLSMAEAFSSEGDEQGKHGGYTAVTLSPTQDKAWGSGSASATESCDGADSSLWLL